MNLSKNTQYPLYFSGHETFPLRQMWLKKVIDIADSNGEILKKKFSDPKLIAELGVGKNMLAAMKHWAQACEIIDAKSIGCAFITDFGNAIFGNGGLDPYSEHPVTIWFMHWKLAKQGSKATTLYWAFNRLNSPSFSKQELQEQLLAVCAKNAKSVSESSLSKDIDANLRGYLSKSHGKSEDITDPIFAELNLLCSESPGHYSFNRGPKPSLNKAAFTYALLEFWEPSKGDSNTLSFDDIAYGDSSPGKVFKLDEDSIVELLMDLDSLTDNKLRWSNTAGIKQVSKTDFDFDGLKQEMLRRAYA